jgi:hypothetical protein
MPDEAYETHRVTWCEAVPGSGDGVSGPPLPRLTHPRRSATFHGVAKGRARLLSKHPGRASPVSTVNRVPLDACNLRAACGLSRGSLPLVSPASDEIPPRGPGTAAIDLEAR